MAEVPPAEGVVPLVVVLAEAMNAEEKCLFLVVGLRSSI